MGRQLDITVRDTTDEDLPAIQAIYGDHVLHGLGTFEETPPTVDEMAVRTARVRDLGLPHLVAEVDGAVCGYCCATRYRPRPAYRHTVEDSVYVADGLQRRGIGRALLSALLTRCARGPWRQMIAVIGDSDNTSSVGLHRSLGFEPVGTLNAVGFKFDRWVDTVLMQRALGTSTDRPFTIRPATAFDLESIRDCLATAFEPYRRSYTAAAYRDTVPAIAGLRERLDAMHVLVAMAPIGEVVGTIACAVTSPGVGYLRGLAVRPHWQGMRVADGLLRAAEQRLRRENCTRVTLDTVEPLQRARRFYEKHAFRPDGRVSDFFSMPLFRHVKFFDRDVRGERP